MGPSGRITHVIGYIGLYCTVWDRICRFCIWVELPVQMRLCPIFVIIVWSLDIHECFRGFMGSQQTPGNGVSHEVMSRVGFDDGIYRASFHWMTV